MADLLFSVNVVLPLFLLVVLGFILRRTGFFTDAFLAVGNKFGFRVLFPVLLFENICDTDWNAVSGLRVALFGGAGIVVSAAVLFVLVPLIVRDNARRSVIIQGIFRGNYLLFGLPLGMNLFGCVTASASVLVAVSIPIFNVIAVTALTVFAPQSGERQRLRIGGILKGILTNPLILGCIAGVVFVLAGISLPAALDGVARDLGTLATPLALIILGGQLRLDSLRGNACALAAVIVSRLVLLPLCMVSIAVALGFRGEALGAIAVLFAAPTAVSSQIMAYNMKADADLAGQIVVGTTVFSALTIFVLVFILKSTGLI